MYNLNKIWNFFRSKKTENDEKLQAIDICVKSILSSLSHRSMAKIVCVCVMWLVFRFFCFDRFAYCYKNLWLSYRFSILTTTWVPFDASIHFLFNSTTSLSMLFEPEKCALNEWKHSTPFPLCLDVELSSLAVPELHNQINRKKTIREILLLLKL